jgi:hypothetical protein
LVITSKQSAQQSYLSFILLLFSKYNNSNSNSNSNNNIIIIIIIMTPSTPTPATETETETETTTPVSENGEVLLTKELNQLSFKDRNDNRGK